MPIDRTELDRLQQAYKTAVDLWVAAIREEEALATPDYTLPAWERWDQAGFKEQDAQEKAQAAKAAYKEGLRQLDYGF
jgi:flagellar biosynthesis/type III secretory pathway protein FliH